MGNICIILLLPMQTSSADALLFLDIIFCSFFFLQMFKGAKLLDDVIQKQLQRKS